MNKLYSIITKNGVAISNDVSIAEVEKSLVMPLNKLIEADIIEPGQFVEGYFKFRIENQRESEIYNKLIENSKKNEYLVRIIRTA